MGLKLFGGALVILAGIMVGYQAGEGLKKRIDQLKRMKRLVMLLRQEVLYRNADFQEAFLETARKMPMPYSGILREISEALERPGESSLSELWQQGFSEGLKGTELKEADIEAFCQLGVHLGYPDAKMQEGAFRLFLEQLEWETEGLLKELPGKRKLCRCLGASAGFLLTIILF